MREETERIANGRVAQEMKRHMKKTTTTKKPLAFITVNFGIKRESATFFQESPSATEKLAILMSAICAVEFSLTT